MPPERRVIMEDVRLLPGQFRNFSGAKGMYNLAGKRSFHVELDEQTAQAMANDGWNVKWPKPKENVEEVRNPHLEVKVSFEKRPPMCVLITSKGRTTLSENEVEILDMVDIAHVDLIINPSRWIYDDRNGWAAYLQSIFVTIEEDYLDRKYSDLPEIGSYRSQPLAIESGQTPSVSNGFGEDGNDDDIVDAEIVG